MAHILKGLLLIGTGLAGSMAAYGAARAETVAADKDESLETILVVAAREARTSRGATNLNLSLAETPQSVTVIGRDIMDAFLLDEANQVLQMTTGVNVESVESDRTYYNSRGFDIKSMQVDGIGLPFVWNVAGALDTVIYDRVEVIRGANGLLTGTGNPSGTINYVRKRPTNDFQAYVEASYGSWDQKRLEADVSGPLTSSGTWAGRLIGAVEDSDSYLDLYHNKRTIFSALIDGQLGENATVTFGYTQQDNKSDGVLWGALTLLDNDGNQQSYDPSTTTSMDWTFWNTHSKTAFAELTYALPAGWEVKGTVTYNHYYEPSELFYVYSGGYDSDTGLGLYGYPGAYDTSSDRWLVDVTVGGNYSLFGREQEAMFGVNMAWADSDYYSYAAPGDDPAWGALPSFPGWTGTELSRPAFGEGTLSSEWSDRVRRFYGATNMHLTDELSVLLGFNAIDVKTEGYSFGEPMDRDESEISPYIGVVYKLTDNLSAYASYSDIYEPQAEAEEDFTPLGAAVGKSYEAGLKGEWLDGKLYTALSVFKASQDNFAEYAGSRGDGSSFYQGIDLRSKGFELEAAGHITDWWSIQAGYTHIVLKDPDGNQARTFLPRDTFKMATTMDIPAVPGLTVGASLRWQDEIYLDTWAGSIIQGAYAIIGATASYDINEHVQVALNVQNLTDKKYLASLYWDQAFYGEPQSVMARLRVRY
ncbi:MAG: TonB-dependent siderophore receptor [Alphaproteobacteria bacterium]|nr:MAG: TonB-dependent siderophore receptor [Alphaproteobacteria bacterium]